MLAQSVTVRFTARSTNGQYHPFESVRVENETQGWSQRIDYPDTIIVLGSSESIDVAEAIKEPQIKVYPNPFAGRTSTELQICEDGEATVSIMRINGSVVSEYNGFMKAGIYRLNVSLAEPQVAFLCVSTRSGRTVAKMVNTATGTADKIDISYLEGYSSQTKAVGIGQFNVGDQMSYNANYTSSNGITTSNTVTKSQTTSELITLFFTESSSTTLPTVTTSTVSNTTSSTAICGGNVTNDGNATVTARGVCWSTSHNPTVSNSHTTDGSGTGSFTSSITGLSENTTYYVRAYATNSFGTAYGNEFSFTTPGTQPVPDGWVDLGLPSGLLWATCNLGAIIPEEYGDYYAWGETQTKSDYSWDTYTYGDDYDPETRTWTMYKYNTAVSFGTVDNKTVLEAMDDAATQVLGGGARIPTADEWQELLDNTTCEWTQHYGVSGREFTAANGNSLFLPAAGVRDGSSLYNDGTGYYWSSSLYANYPIHAWSFGFYSGGSGVNYGYYRYYGFSVRAVRSRN